jgi:hypothetical protein
MELCNCHDNLDFKCFQQPQNKTNPEVGVVSYACNSSTRETEAEESCQGEATYWYSVSPHPQNKKKKEALYSLAVPLLPIPLPSFTSNPQPSATTDLSSLSIDWFILDIAYKCSFVADFFHLRDVFKVHIVSVLISLFGWMIPHCMNVLVYLYILQLEDIYIVSSSWILGIILLRAFLYKFL